jgi:signal transduction histidine kinase
VDSRPVSVPTPRHDLAVDALDAFDQATRAIAGVVDLESALQLITDRVRMLVDAQYAALGIADAHGRMERFITSGISREARRKIGEPPRGHGILGLIIRTGSTYRIADIAGHADSYGFPPNHPPMHSFLGVPIRIKGGSLGNLYLTNKQGAAEFSNADERLVEMFARHAAIAIENARLHARVQQLAVVEERDRIARDLHDGIIQSIYAVALSLEDVPEMMGDSPADAAARVDRAIDRLNLTIRDIRNFILGLGSELSEAGELGAGIAGLAEEVRVNTLIEIEVDLDDAHRVEAGLPDGHRAQLLQIAREALSNMARHSRATTGRVSLHERDGTAVLEVADDGRGFDPGMPVDPGHHGLDNLHDRATAMSGDLVVDSKPDGGTRIIVRVPLDAPPEAQS